MSKEQFRLLVVVLVLVIVAAYFVSQRRLAQATARGLALAEEEAKRRDALAQQTAETLIACVNAVAERLTRVSNALIASEMNRQIEAANRLEVLKEANERATWPPMGFTAMPFATE